MTLIALLRGINVGGRNAVRMAELRRVFETAGHRDVRTYVQSGNVVFRAEGREDPASVAADLAARILDEFGVATTVLVRTAEEFASIVADNPYAEAAAADPTTVHAALLSAEPADPAAYHFDAERYAPEQIAPGDRVLYLHLPGGLGRSQLATDLARRRTDVEVTVRNWRTMTRLLAMAQDGPR